MNLPARKQTSTHLGPMQYRDVGEGPVLVFLHTILGDETHWDRVVPLLQDQFRCILPVLPLGVHELPAHADADLSCAGIVRALAELLDHLELTEVALVGNDTGGALAQVFAATYPDRLSRVVLTNCDMFEVFPPKMFSYFRLMPYVPGSMAMAGRIFTVRRLRGLPMVLGALTHAIDHDKVDRWAAALLAQNGVRRDVLSVIRGLRPAVTMAAVETLKTTDVPFLLVWGADDRLFKPSLAERFCATVPTATMTMVEDSKTFVCWDQPEALATHIRAFC